MREHAAWDDLPDTGEDASIIDYWVWRDDHLVPATSEDIAGIEAEERPRRTSRRPAHLRSLDLCKVRRMRRRLPLIGRPPLVTSWLLAMRPRRRIAHEEGAHAEHSITGR